MGFNSITFAARPANDLKSIGFRKPIKGKKRNSVKLMGLWP